MSDGIMDGVKNMAGMMSGDMEKKMTAMTADMKRGLEGLSGNDFDKAFIEMMIMHHTQAVEVAKLAATNAGHDQLKAKAADIIDAQKEESSQLQQWLTEWGL